MQSKRPYHFNADTADNRQYSSIGVQVVNMITKNGAQIILNPDGTGNPEAIDLEPIEAWAKGIKNSITRRF